MPTIVRKVFLTFPQKLVREPIVYNLGHEFNVTTNIRGASVTDEYGLVALELEGDAETIEKALAYLRARDVAVEPMESDEAPSA